MHLGTRTFCFEVYFNLLFVIHTLAVIQRRFLFGNLALVVSWRLLGMLMSSYLQNYFEIVETTNTPNLKLTFLTSVLSFFYA